ncbi:Hypothetical predicted protein [Paramuricea clavata]|uniref:Uncharacterized protein n=1 Tax=Paramuricea clavata TaxID=317549 RepID=A0A7D9IKW8_PARCT|nr:Hypothetical predicted protein [Paramuricea clavata]
MPYKVIPVIPQVQRSLGLVDIKVEICDVADVSTASKRSEAAVLLQKDEIFESDDTPSNLLQEIVRGEAESDIRRSKAPEKFQTEHPDKILPLVDVKAGKLPLVKGDSGVQLTASTNVASTSALFATELQSTPEAHVDEVYKAASEIKCDTVSQIINSEKALSLVHENAGDIPVTKSTPLPVVKNVDEWKDHITSSDGATSYNLLDEPSTSQQGTKI